MRRLKLKCGVLLHLPADHTTHGCCWLRYSMLMPGLMPGLMLCHAMLMLGLPKRPVSVTLFNLRLPCPTCIALPCPALPCPALPCSQKAPAENQKVCGEGASGCLACVRVWEQGRWGCDLGWKWGSKPMGARAGGTWRDHRIMDTNSFLLVKTKNLRNPASHQD